MTSARSPRLRLAALALALALAPAARAEAPQPVRLQLKWFHQFQFAGYYAAEARGFYRDEGLAVEIIEGSPERAPVDVVLAGQAEFGVHGGGDVLVRRLEGAPVVALAAVFQHSPAVVVTRKRDGLLHPSDLAGRTLMLTTKHGEAEVQAMFRREGIRLDGPDPARSVRTVPHSWNVADLVEGRVDALSAYLTSEPALLRRRGVEVSVLRPVEYGIDFYGDVLFTGERYLAASPEVAQRFVRASLRGWAWAMANPEAAADLVLARPSQRTLRPDRATLLEEARAMRELVLPDLVELGHMNPGRWERMADEYRLLGVVKDTSRVAGFVPEDRSGRLLRGVAWTLGAAVLLALAIALWAWQLRRTVRARTAELWREGKRLEAKSAELEQSLQANRAMLAAIPDLIFVIRRDGTFLDYRARRDDGLVAPPEAFLGRKAADVLPARVAGRLVAAYQRAIDDDRPQQLEYSLDLPDGRHRFEARVVRQGPDTALSIVRDVTEDHQVRERLALLAAAIEAAGEDVIVTDADKVIRYVNPSFERTTGWPSADALGKTPAILRSGRHDATFYQAIWSSIAAGRPWQGRLTNRARDGRLILQDATIVAIRDAAGAVTGYVSTRTDVTERAALEAQLATARRMEAVGTLAGGIAHDFNNILAAIVGNAELAQASVQGNPAAEEEVASILKASQRASDLVRQILAFSRPSAQAERPVKLSAVVWEAVKLLRASLPPDVAVETRVGSDAQVRADPAELQRVVLNLATNAVHAMRDGGGRLELRLEEVEIEAGPRARLAELTPGRHLRLSVRDGGCGMTAEVRARVFEPFFTTRKPGEGTGLGLSIVHGVVRRLGGAVSVESEPGQGSTFEVLLPVLEAAPAPAPEPPAAAPPPGRGRIVVVDDEPMVVRVMEKGLSRLGYQVSGFTSGAEALEMMAADPGDFVAVVSDLAMPELGGEVLARRVRELRPALPVILCSGNRHQLDDEALASLGVAEVLDKPVGLATLAAALGRVIGPVETAPPAA